MDDDLTPAQIAALSAGPAADREVLRALLHHRIGQWPWWDRAWQIIEIHRVHSREIIERLHGVMIEGTVGRDAGETLPLSVRARVIGSRLDQFEARIGETVIGPPHRIDDPHPFGAILSALMDRRGISRQEMARRCRLAESTVAKMRSGMLVPRRRERVENLAAALGMPAGDLMAIAGLPEDD